MNSIEPSGINYPLRPAKVRYVKLGTNGSWESSATKDGILRIGFDTGDPKTYAMCRERRWEELAASWRPARTGAVATRYANETRIFFDDPGDILWVTFAGDILHWGFLEPGLPQVFAPDDPKDESTFRKIVGGWRSCDPNGELLKKSSLPGSITKAAYYRGTSFFLSASNARLLLARINGQRLPEVERLEAARLELIGALEPLIQRLDDKDFEALADMIFIGAGWRRIGRIGGTTRDKDLDLQRPITGDSAFVQVKCATNQATLDDYIRRLDEMEPYDEMYFVYHTSKKPIATGDARVTVLGPKEIAEMVVESGLIDWVAQKAS